MRESADRAPRLIELRFTPQPRDAAWELSEAGAGARVGLLGWVLDAPNVDAGVPPKAAGIVARAACRQHVLIFHHRVAIEHGAHRTWIDVPGGWTCVLEPPTIKRLLGRPALPLVATSDPARAEELFHSEGFSWELRAQTVLLFQAGSPPPSLSYVMLEDALSGRASARPRLGLPADIRGLLLPGVDGDFVELVAFDEPLWRTLPAELASECAKSGVGWNVVSEDEFKQTRWFRQSGPSEPA